MKFFLHSKIKKCSKKAKKKGSLVKQKVWTVEQLTSIKCILYAAAVIRNNGNKVKEIQNEIEVVDYSRLRLLY